MKNAFGSVVIRKAAKETFRINLVVELDSYVPVHDFKNWFCQFL